MINLSPNYKVVWKARKKPYITTELRWKTSTALYFSCFPSVRRLVWFCPRSLYWFFYFLAGRYYWDGSNLQWYLFASINLMRVRFCMGESIKGWVWVFETQLYYLIVKEWDPLSRVGARTLLSNHVNLQCLSISFFILLLLVMIKVVFESRCWGPGCCLV